MTAEQSVDDEVSARKPAALQEVELPSGWKVRGIPPSVIELLRWDLVPDDLLVAASHYADPTWFDREKVDPDALKRRVEEQRLVTQRMVLAFVRDEFVDGEWQPRELTLEDIGRPPRRTVSFDDLNALENIVLGHMTPAQVTAVTRAIEVATAAAAAAGATPDEAADAGDAAGNTAAEAAVTDTTLTRFRDEPAGGSVGGDREVDGPAPVRSRRDRRAAGARVPARRGGRRAGSDRGAPTP